MSRRKRKKNSVEFAAQLGKIIQSAVTVCIWITEGRFGLEIKSLVYRL